jgi:hypothetical protein
MPRKREVIELLDSDSEEGGGGGSDYEPTAAAKKAPKRKAAAAPKAKQPRAPKAPKKEAEEKRTGPDGKTVRFGCCALWAWVLLPGCAQRCGVEKSFDVQLLSRHRLCTPVAAVTRDLLLTCFLGVTP